MAWSSGIHGLSSAAAIAISHRPAVPLHAQLDLLMLFGCVSVLATGVSYANRRRCPVAMLTFAASLAASALYGFVEGAWPLGMACAFHAFRRSLICDQLGWRRRRMFVPDLESRQSRYRQVFGSN
jgi:hypothetical protein